MQRSIQCVTLSGNKIEGFGTIQDLLEIAGDEVFLIDMNAIKKGKPSFDFYQEISKFVDVYVLSLVSKVDDLVDTLILGCEGVVISPRVEGKKLIEFLSISENLIMPYTPLPSSREFSRLGGKYFISNVMVNHNFSLTYYYGPGNPGDNYVRLKDFPLDFQKFALE